MHDVVIPKGAPLPPGYRLGTEFTGPGHVPMAYIERVADGAVLIALLCPGSASEAEIAAMLATSSGWSR